MGANVITGKLASSTDLVTGSRLALTVKGTSSSFGLPSYINGNLSGYGTIYQIKKNGDILEGAEYVKDVVPKIDGTYIGLLKHGRFLASDGDYEYEQTLDTPQYAASAYEYDTGIPDDDTEIPAAYMVFPKDIPVYAYALSFFSDAKSKVDTSANSYRLKDFEDGKISILGKDFTVLKAEHPAANSVNLVLLSGEIKDTLKEGEKKDYVINGTMYTIEAVAITDKSPYQVLFSINGNTIRSMSESDSGKFGSLNLAVSDIIPNEAGDVTSDLVSFYIDSFKVELADTDVSSSSLGGQELKVNDVRAEDTDVQIGALDPGLVEDSEFRLSDIIISWTPSRKHYLGTEKYMSDIVEDKNVLFGDLDYYYYGSNPNNDAEAIELVNKGDKRYILSFENIEGEKLDVPLFYLSGSGFTRYGTEDNRLVVNESMQVSDNDYFIVTSDGYDLATKAEGITRLYRYKSQNINDDTISLFDIGSNSSVELRYTNGIAHLQIGGSEIKINVTQDAVDDGNITVDMNNDEIGRAHV
jgi:hypothetical protein